MGSLPFLVVAGVWGAAPFLLLSANFLFFFSQMEKRRKVAQRERRRKESSTKKASRMRAEFISFSFALVAWASLLSWLVACGLQPPLTHQKRSQTTPSLSKSITPINFISLIIKEIDCWWIEWSCLLLPRFMLHEFLSLLFTLAARLLCWLVAYGALRS